MPRVRSVVGVLANVGALLAGSAAAVAQRSDFVRVTVVEEHVYGRAAYRYAVENNTRTRTIVAVRVGDDYKGTRAELQQPPYGWTDDKGLPLGSAAAPDGWTVEAVREEEDQRWFVEWFSSEDDETLDIAPGQMLDGFTVIVSDAAPEYLSSHWTVVFDNGQRVSGVIERERP